MDQLQLPGPESGSACRLHTSAYALHTIPRVPHGTPLDAGLPSECRNTCIPASCAILQYETGSRNRTANGMAGGSRNLLKSGPHLALLSVHFRYYSEIPCVAVSDGIVYRRLGKPRAIPTTGSGPYTYIKPVVTRNGTLLPSLASPHVRGAARMRT